MEKGLLICSFVFLSVCNGFYVSDDGSQTETPEPVGTRTGPASSLEKAQQAVNSLLLPGPAIFEKVDENQFPDLDKSADQSMQDTENVVEDTKNTAAQSELAPVQINMASGTVASAPSNMAPVSEDGASAPSHVTSVQGDEASASSYVASVLGDEASAPSNIAPVSAEETSGPSNVASAQGSMDSAPGEMASVPINADSGSVASAPSNEASAPDSSALNQNILALAPSSVLTASSDLFPVPSIADKPASNSVADQQNTTADAPLESNTGVSLNDAVEEEKTEPVEPQNDNHASLEEPGMLDMTGNESWWNNGDVEQSKEKIKSGEKTIQDDINEEKVLDDNTEESSKIDDYNFEEDDDWWMEDNYDDNDAEWLEEGEDKNDGEDGWLTDKQDDDDDVDDDDVDDDDDSWWEEEDDDDDVAYDDDTNWFEDYNLADTDNDDSDDVEDWPEDADGDYDNYDDSKNKEISGKISETTTEQAWLGTTTDDYDYSSEEDDYSSEDVYGPEEDEYKDDEGSIQAGKELIESAHSFDNTFGAFAGTKVSSKTSLQSGSFYTWTLLLTICLVLVGLFIFWNRHKVEKYVVSLRHPKPNGQNVARRKDEEENLLENEYA